jgi:hypothetical protein
MIDLIDAIIIGAFTLISIVLYVFIKTLIQHNKTDKRKF